MKNRVFALIMTICMIFSITSVSALAGDTNESKDTCTCSSLCTEENIDYECPVCDDDFTKCAYEVENKENVTDTSVDKGGTQETPECVCEKLCSEENINKDCEACLSDYSLCKGIDDENNNTENITDDKEEESKRIHEEGCILDAGHEGDCVTNDTVMLFSYVRDSKEIYVSFSGNDDENDGTTKQSPYKTLAKAVDEAKDGDTIVAMDDITVEGINGTARVTDKHIVITSIDPENPVTITRGDNLTISDDNQSWYNSAIIEVTTNENEDNENASSVTLENIILTDNGKHGGTYFAQTNTEIDGNDAGNRAFVQDGMVTAHGKSNRQVYIILGEGAVLKDFGGMSAVYATGGANIVMKGGSKITAENVTDRQKSSNKAPSEETGPAGAIWMQGSTLVMEEDSSIENIIGRAVYIDGGTAEIDGNISGITGDGDMWQGKSGVAIHLRGGAEAELQSNSSIKDIEIQGGNAVKVLAQCSFYMKDGSVISDVIGGSAVSGSGSQDNDEDNIEIYIDGEITGVKNGTGNNTVNAVNLNESDGLHCTIGPNAYIHENTVWYGAVYIQGSGIHLDHYGRIEDNYSTDKSGGICLANNFSGHSVTMYKGATVKNNVSKNDGAGVLVSCGTFTMEGGEISGNISTGYEDNGIAGGVYVRRGGTFIMNGGDIKGNYAKGAGGGLYYDAQDYRNRSPRVVLNGGEISDNIMMADIELDTSTGNATLTGGISNDVTISDSAHYSNINRYISISNDMTVDDDSIYIKKYNVMLKNPSNNIKFGNTSDDAVDVLNKASNANGWSQALASLWCQNDENATELIMSIPAGIDPDLPVYAAVVETDVTGNALSGANVEFYNVAKGNGSLDISFLSGNENGYAIALVQPSADYGSMTLSGPEKLNEGKDTYTITYDADYSMSTNLYEILKSNINDTNDLNYARMIIQLDSRLSVKSEDIIVNSNIFETNGDISVNVNEITINLKLKDGWEIQSDTNTSITINAEMANDKFESGKVLAASGRFEASVPVPDSSLNVIVPSNAVRTEMAKAEVYEITVSAGSNGTISPSGTISVNQGENLKLTITPDEGYVISDVIVDGVSQGNITSYTFENIVSDHSIRAEFEKKSSGSSSSSSSSGVSLSEAHYVRYYDGDDKVVDDKYAYGERVTVKDNVFTAPEGMVLAGWSREEGGKVDYIPGDTFRMPDSSVNLYAVWKEAVKTHYAYMSGYPDGTIRPDNTITRAEAAQIFYNLLPEKNIPYTVTFKDVTADKWYYKAVNVLASLNIISGVGDGYFEPERPVSRAEFTAMAMRFGGENAGGENIFNDVYGYEWFYDDIVSSINYGWIKGYPDGSFRPYNSITRAEAVTVINNMLGRSADIYYIEDNVNDVKYFTDLDKDFWAYYQMAEAANGHTYKNIDGEENWTDAF